MNKHFKKYFFYFVARILDLIGRYDDSIAFYSIVIHIRTFFWDAQERFERAYQRSSKKCYLEIFGGVGDLLQHLPFILRNKSAHYIVATHFKGAPAFFKSLNIKVDQYYFYAKKEEYREIRNLLKQNKNSYICPRALFFKAPPFVTPRSLKNTKRKVMGVHPGASALGNHKAIPVSFTKKLIGFLNQEGYKVILFGTKKELSEIQVLKNKDIIFASDTNIIKNLSLVECCDLFIGSDSVFKTMASMLKLPTIVLHQDHKNNFRDRVFIEPYVNSHIMHVYKYTNFNEVEMKYALQFISNVMKSEINSLVRSDAP
jgi:ADP-heptose:LPS heptosyltransferase